MLSVSLILIVVALLLAIFALARNNFTYLAVSVLLIAIDLLLSPGAELFRH